MRIVVLRAKGGSGGSTVSLSLAKHFAYKGKKVLLVDSDVISTISSVFGLRGLGLIQLVKEGQPPEKAVVNMSLRNGSLTVLKIFSDGVPVEYERIDLVKNIEDVSEAYLGLLKKGNFDVTIVDTLPATTPLEPIVGWESSTYRKYVNEKSKYIMVSEPVKPSIEASIRYYGILKEKEHITSGIDVAVLNKVDTRVLSYNEIFSTLLEFMERIDSHVGVVLAYQPELSKTLEDFENMKVPVQIMELAHYLERPPLTKKVVIPQKGDLLKKVVFQNVNVLLKTRSIGGAEDTIRLLANMVREYYKESSLFLFSATSTMSTPNIINFKTIYSFLSERSKVKSLDDAIRLAKRLAIEISDEVKKYKFEKNIIVFYLSNDIEPIVEQCDLFLLSKSFWNELLLQLTFTLENTSVIVVCNPQRANCHPLEELVDMTLEVSPDQEGLNYLVEFSKV